MSYYNLTTSFASHETPSVEYLHMETSHFILSRRSLAIDHFDFHSPPFCGFKNEYCAFSELSY
jgi:hypothetical protein